MKITLNLIPRHVASVLMAIDYWVGTQPQMTKYGVKMYKEMSSAYKAINRQISKKQKA